MQFLVFLNHWIIWGRRQLWLVYYLISRHRNVAMVKEMGERVSQCEIKIGGHLYHVEPLHNVPHYLDECCKLINAEWKRSHVARMRSIEKSSENFPMSLVVLRKSKDKKVVGHCKLSKVGHSDIFVETVIIHPSLRGKGLGKFLMEQVEEVAKKKKMKCLYLSTQGQEIFYKKLGYSECPPINIYGCQLSGIDEDKLNKCESEPKIRNDGVQNSNNAPIPPPLPVPKALPSCNISTNKTFMKKQIIY